MSRPVSAEPVELADEPVYAEADLVSAYDDRPVRRAGRGRRSALLAELDRAAARPRRRRPRRRQLHAVRENKFYADLAGTSTTQQRVRVQPELTAIAVDRSTGARSRPCAPSPRRSAAAGSTSPAPAGTGTPRSPRCPELLAEKMQGAVASRPGATTWSSTRPTCGSRSTSRSGTPPSSTARSATRRRTRGPRSRPSTSSAPARTARPVMNVTGDRDVEHGLATIGYDDEGVADAAVGHRPGRHPGRVPARPADGRAEGPRPVATGARSPTRPGTSRCSGWPTCRLQPAPDGPYDWRS